MKEITQEQILTARVYGDIPDLKPGQILISPSTNRLYDKRIHPIDNFLNFPDWFKDLDPSKHNIKRCQGTQDYLTTGMTLRLPCDVRIRLDHSGRGWEARYDTPEVVPFLQVDSFSYEQTGPIPATEGRLVQTGNWVKIVNPWEIRSAPGWSCMTLPVLWEQKREWSIMPGVVHTDFYHHMNWVVNIFSDEPEFVIEMGTPIAHIITFPRNVRTEVLFGDEKIHELLAYRGMGEIFAGYESTRKMRYRRSQRAADATCPVFHDTQASPSKPRKRGIFSLFRRRGAGNM